MKQANTSITTQLEHSNSDKLLLQSLENAHEIIYSVNADGLLNYLNTYGQQHLGIKEDAISNTTIFSIYPDITPEQWETAIALTRENGHWQLHTRTAIIDNQTQSVEICLNHHQTNQNNFFCISKNQQKETLPGQLLSMITKATVCYSEQAFLEKLMMHMALAMHVRMAFITECMDQPPNRVRMLAFWSADRFVDNLEYDLEGTPCNTVINSRQNFLVESDLGEIYPKEKGFAESYVGIPIYDSEGKLVIGHMAFLDDNKLSHDDMDYATFEILASRISVELQRMRAENSLQKSEEKYRFLVENQTDLIMRLGTDARLLFASPSCCSHLGKDETALLKTSFFDHIHQEEQLKANEIWQHITATNETLCEFRTLTSKGWCWFAWSLKKVSDLENNTIVIIAVGHDVSQRRRAEDEARKTIQQLAHVGRLSSMGEMASGIAHELNQPLTAIMSFSQACQRMLDANMSDMEQYKTILGRIANNAELAGDIIRRVRSFVRKGESAKTPIDIHLLIQEVYNLLGTELRHCNVQLIIHMDRSVARVLGDQIQIQQVLVNLIRNAIDAICDNNMQVREIHISANKVSPHILAIEVRDSGPGIAHEIQEQLLDAFVTTKPQGLGIGLSICNTIIENHGGELSASSLAGKGATFRFTLPIVDMEENA